MRPISGDKHDGVSQDEEHDLEFEAGGGNGMDRLGQQAVNLAAGGFDDFTSARLKIGSPWGYGAGRIGFTKGLQFQVDGFAHEVFLSIKGSVALIPRSGKAVFFLFLCQVAKQDAEFGIWGATEQKLQLSRRVI